MIIATFKNDTEKKSKAFTKKTLLSRKKFWDEHTINEINVTIHYENKTQEKHSVFDIYRLTVSLCRNNYT